MTSVVVDNIWANNEGTVTVDPVNTADRWLHPNELSSTLFNAHQRLQLDMDRDRIVNVVSGITNQKAHELKATSSVPTPGQIWDDGCYFSPANGSNGGFRGVPAYKDIPRRGVIGVYGSLTGVGNGQAPAVTQLIQGNLLPNKSRGQINDEILDHERLKGLAWHYKGESHRP